MQLSLLVAVAVGIGATDCKANYFGRELPKVTNVYRMAGDFFSVGPSDVILTICKGKSVTSKMFSAVNVFTLQRSGDRGDDASLEELNNEFGWTGAKFDEPMPIDAAKIIANYSRAEVMQNDILSMFR
jgi:hypothetical protein